MSRRRPIRTSLHAGPAGEEPPRDGEETGQRGPSDAAVSADGFREGLSRWASTVTLVAARDADTGQVHATTATSFAPVAAEPPSVVIALGPRAQVLPFLDVGVAVGVSLLREDQKRWATVFADAFPVRTPVWSYLGGAPVLPDAVTALACEVLSIQPVEGGAALVLCRADHVALGDTERPLLYWNRSYTRLTGG